MTSGTPAESTSDSAADTKSDPSTDAAPPRFLTIGHSHRTLEEFLGLLRDTGTEVVVDVRKLPGSNANPQFNEDVLGDALAAAGIELRRLEGLTGRRLVSKDVPFDVNAWWENRSFHNYADHALTQEFAHDIGELLAWGDERRCAVMCSEAVWWRCHRRIIADHLLAHGQGVVHVLGPDQTAEAVLSAGAVVETVPADAAVSIGPDLVVDDADDASTIRITYPKQ